MSTAVANEAATETATNTPLGQTGLASLLMAEDPPEVVEEEAPETEEEEPEAPEEEAPEVAEEEPEAEEEEPQSIVDRLNLGELSEEERIELNRELGGRSSERIGKLTAEKKHLQEELASLRGQLEKRDPFESESENPYQGESDPDKLKEHMQAALSLIREGEEALEDNEGLLADEEIEVFGGRYTKKQIRQAMRNAKSARDVHLPARARELEKVAGYEAEREQRLGQLQKIHPWLTEDGNKYREYYEAEAPEIVAKVRQHIPELLPRIDAILTAATSWVISQHESALDKEPKKKAAPKRKPPGSPGGSAGGSSRPLSSSKKKQAKLNQFLESSGSQADAAKMFMP